MHRGPPERGVRPGLLPKGRKIVILAFARIPYYYLLNVVLKGGR